MFKPNKLLLSAGLRQLEARTSLQTGTTSTAPGCHHHYCHHHLRRRHHHHRLLLSKTNNLNLRRHLTKSWRFAYIPLRLGAPARLKWKKYIGSIFSRLFASNAPDLFILKTINCNFLPSVPQRFPNLKGWSRLGGQLGERLSLERKVTREVIFWSKSTGFHFQE